MKDEIKEILAYCNEYIKNTDMHYSEPMLNWKDLKMLLDYITNLQQENERLKETNVYCNRTDCVGRIKDSRKYDSVYQEKEDYKSRCEKAIEITQNLLNTENSGYYKIIFQKQLDTLNGRSDE